MFSSAATPSTSSTQTTRHVDRNVLVEKDGTRRNAYMAIRTVDKPHAPKRQKTTDRDDIFIGWQPDEDSSVPLDDGSDEWEDVHQIPADPREMLDGNGEPNDSDSEEEPSEESSEGAQQKGPKKRKTYASSVSAVIGLFLAFVLRPTTGRSDVSVHRHGRRLSPGDLCGRGAAPRRPLCFLR